MCDVLLDFSVRLNDVLRKKGISYTERKNYLVDLIGLHHKTVHNWLTGVACPSMEVSEHLAELLDTTHLYLMTGVGGNKGYFQDVIERLVGFLRDTGVSEDNLSISLSRIASVTHSSAISWLEGRTHPTFNKLEEISVNLKVKSYWLLTGCNTSNVSDDSRRLLSLEVEKYNQLVKIRIKKLTQERKKDKEGEMERLRHNGFAERLNTVMTYYGYPTMKRDFFLADISKAPKLTANLWLKGKEFPSLRDAQIIANYFKISNEWLYLGEGNFTVNCLPIINTRKDNESHNNLGFSNRLNQILDDAHYPQGKERYYLVQALIRVSSLKAVRGWCLGNNVPRLEIVSTLALALNVKLDWLYLGVTIPNDLTATTQS